MKSTSIAAALGSLLASMLAGCQSKSIQHEIKPPALGTVVVCAKCYDETVKVRRYGGGPNRTILRHACDDCEAEMSVYRERDILMIKCAVCAPEGVPCDRCVPFANAGKDRRG